MKLVEHEELSNYMKLEPDRKKHELLFCKDCEHAKPRPDFSRPFWYCGRHRKFITEYTVINSYSDDRECKDYRGKA